MKKLLLAALVLTGLAGCSKSDPTPTPTTNPTAPTVVAKWQADSTWSSGGTAATQYAKLKIRIYPAKAITTEITATQYIVYAGSVIDSQYPYTLAGNVLHIAQTGGPADIYNDQTIKVLTSNRMVLVSLVPQQNGKANQYATTTTTYSR